MYKGGKHIKMNKFQPVEIEKARKIVRRYKFRAFPYEDVSSIINRLKPIMDDIEGFEHCQYELVECYPQYNISDSKGYDGILEVTYLSVERELYIFRY